jgi:predicted enzyme related to lactoylglutathione lyase
VRIRLFRVIVPVDGIDRAAAFYGAIFGNDGERVSVNRHYFDCDGVVLALVDPTPGGQQFRPNPDHVYLAVDDLETAYERAKAAGCQWLEDGIKTRDWGERSFYARDPFGNPLCFVDETTLFTGGRFVP